MPFSGIKTVISVSYPLPIGRPDHARQNNQQAEGIQELAEYGVSIHLAGIAPCEAATFLLIHILSRSFVT